MKKPLVILNLASVFAIAFSLSAFLHELAHAIVAKLIHVQPVLFHSYVSYDASSTPHLHQAFVSGGGPLFSMVQAVLFFFLLRRRTKPDFVGLFYLWMTVVGMIIFLGYVIMGPLIPYGDTGRIYSLMHVPEVIGYSLAGIALTTMIFCLRKAVPVMATFMSQLKTESGLDHSRSLWRFYVLPLCIGTLVNLIVSLPAPTLMSLAAPFAISLAMIPSAIRLFHSNLTPAEGNASATMFSKTEFWPVVVMVAMVVISRILATGIRL